jgi:hypothetical protein
MPEVTRIEKTFPGPSGYAAAMKEYPAMRDQAKKDLLVYRSAIIAAEKASPRPISEYGAAAVKKGRSVWAGSDQVNKARLAQVWMSWSPPADCETRAKTLETKSNLFGQALNYNVKKGEAPVPSATEPSPAVEATQPVAEPQAPAPAETPVADAALPAIGSTPAAMPIAAKGEVVIDPANPQPCAGSLLPAKRGGKNVLICKTN